MKEVRYFSATNFKKFMMGLGFPTHSYNRNVLAKDFIETFNFAIISIGNVECEKVGDNDVDLWLNGPDNHWIPSCGNSHLGRYSCSGRWYVRLCPCSCLAIYNNNQFLIRIYHDSHLN